MCGIAGFCNFTGDIEKNIAAMCEALRHRGPDAGGVWLSADRAVALGHRRLRIIDLTETGAQPMQSASGRYVITFNGEIYNYKRIADKLQREKKVAAFRGSSDTEVLLEAIEAYGLKETLALCKGMFAFALYDTQERTLYLARDRVGEKPLYYGMVGGAFVFASELGALTALAGFDNAINTDVLSLYFIHGYVPAPYSIYQDIYKLEAGTFLTIAPPYREGRAETYWSIKEVAAQGQSHLFKGSRPEAAEELERLLKEALREQMVADVPVGAFLSAGIDSSTIVALMQSLLTERVKSFTIGMPAPMTDEAVYAKKVAAHLGLDHTERYISEEDAKAIIPMLGGMFGEPFADSSQIPTYLVSKITREQVTVSLSGDAGDELFCGYNSYRSVERIKRKLGRVPYFIRYPASRVLLSGLIPLSRDNRIRANLLGINSTAQLYINSYEFDPRFRQISKTDKEISYKYNEIEPCFIEEPNQQVMLMDLLMYHPDDILVKVDRTAMAVALETRVPLLDKDVVEFAWSLPIEYKRNKRVLRDVLYRHVPRELMERPKQGFGIPVGSWLKEPGLRSWAEQLIARDTLTKQGLLAPDIVHQLWDDFISRDLYIPQIWHILMFQNFMEGRKR